MKLECPKCLTEALVDWWLHYDGGDDAKFEEVETAIEYLQIVIGSYLFRPAVLCESHREEQEEALESKGEVAAHG